MALARGRNEIVIDEDGKRYIDFVSGIGVGSVGHCHPHYVRSLKKQIGQLTYGSFTTEVRMKFLRLLASLLPKPLRRIQLFSGGAEAVEAAFRLAKSVTKKFEFVGFWGGFHGKTGGVLGLLGDEFKKDLGPFMPGSLPLSLCLLLPMPAEAALPILRLGLCRAPATGDQIAEPATSGRHHSGADPGDRWERRAAAGISAGRSIDRPGVWRAFYF